MRTITDLLRELTILELAGLTLTAALLLGLPFIVPILSAKLGG